MSNYPNQQRQYDPNPQGGLPKINDKRFADVIDYNQPRPQSSYNDQQGGYPGQQASYDNRNYHQGAAAADRNQPGGYGAFANNNNAGYSKDVGQEGARGASVGFNVQEGQPIQLVIADPRTGQFTLNEEAAAELMATYEGNVSFVTITGKHQTGKSFLVNRLLNLKGEGFPVDPNAEACTQGIWIWSQPVYSEKDNTHIFFLDVEGSHHVNKSAPHDAKVFALAVLMSSYLIYNSTGGINENSINDLTLATQLAKNIAVSPEENNDYALSFYTPKLLWALRDFSLDGQSTQGKPQSANQYMESALTDPNIYGKSSDTNKKIRQSLITYFKDRECIAFPQGSNDTRRLNTLPDNQLKPEFLKQVALLREKILSKASAKQLRGVNLNMRMYVTMVNKYLEALNHGGVPNINEAWNTTIEVEGREAYEQSVDLFEIALKQFFFNEDKAKSVDDLYNILKNIRDSTLEKYNKITAPIERHEVIQDFKNELKDYIDKKEQQVVVINEELNQANNEDLLNQITQPIKNNMNAGHYGPNNIKDFHEDFDQFLDMYETEGQGFSKNTGLVNFLKTFQPELVSSLMLALNKSYQGNQKNIDQDKKIFSENEANLKKNLEALRTKEKNANDELARLKAEKAELANKTTRLTEQLSKQQQEEQAKLEAERNKLKLEANKFQQKDKEFQDLSKHHKELMEQMNKRKNACCNIF